MKTVRMQCIQPDGSTFVMDALEQNVMFYTSIGYSVSSCAVLAAKQVKGVLYHKASGKYQAFIFVNGKRHHLGTFVHKPDAVNARLQAEAKKQH